MTPLRFENIPKHWVRIRNHISCPPNGETLSVGLHGLAVPAPFKNRSRLVPTGKQRQILQGRLSRQERLLPPILRDCDEKPRLASTLGLFVQQQDLGDRHNSDSWLNGDSDGDEEWILDHAMLGNLAVPCVGNDLEVYHGQRRTIMDMRSWRSGHCAILI
jgi:hypothetical protein